MNEDLVQHSQDTLCIFSQEKRKLLKDTVCKGASDSEFELFLHVCIKTGLDPFMKQIYSIPRGGQRTIQTSVDGFRLIAERTGRYSPGREPSYVYTADGILISATSTVKKMTADGTWHEVSATAFNAEYNSRNTFWTKMPHLMLAKCAECLALRRAFPAEMSGIYSDEEMQQANVKLEETKVIEIDPKDMEEKFRKFVENAPVDQDLLVEYLTKYTTHWKKTPEETMEIYSDGEKFSYDFEKWKSKHFKK